MRGADETGIAGKRGNDRFVVRGGQRIGPGRRHMGVAIAHRRGEARQGIGVNCPASGRGLSRGDSSAKDSNLLGRSASRIAIQDEMTEVLGKPLTGKSSDPGADLRARQALAARRGGGEMDSGGVRLTAQRMQRSDRAGHERDRTANHRRSQ